MNNLIATVDKNDRVTGYDEKQKVHVEGLLHRAFSIFIFNSAGELMMHQRALMKYHSPGLWTNTCCSHLPEGLDMEQATHLRLMEEMGFDAELKFVEKFHYRIDFDNGLTENEIDHIYIGFFDGDPKPDADEVESYAWMTLPNLKADIEANPQKYTYWLKHIMEHYYSELCHALAKYQKA
jgi:isopentenyl-diphosphate delta-isomerase